MSFFYDDPSLAEDRAPFEGLFDEQLPLPIQPRPLVETIVKRDGRIEIYDARQIVNAIREAARSIGRSDIYLWRVPASQPEEGTR